MSAYDDVALEKLWEIFVIKLTTDTVTFCRSAMT